LEKVTSSFFLECSDILRDWRGKKRERERTLLKRSVTTDFHIRGHACPGSQIPWEQGEQSGLLKREVSAATE
jgi:hypothetical protein